MAKLANYASTNLAQIGQRWHRFLLNRRWIANTAQLTPSELQRMARDVGLDERDLHTRGCNHPGPTELMPQRLKLLGLDPDYIRHALPTPYRDLESVFALQIMATLRARHDQRRCAVWHGQLLPQRRHDRRPNRRAGELVTYLTRARSIDPVWTSEAAMDWPMYRRVENRARRLHEMMERLDVDAGALARLRGGDTYAEARSRCLFCGTGDKCLRWIEQSGNGVRPEFCPNLALFESCRRKV